MSAEEQGMARDIEQALAETLHKWRKTQALAGCGWEFGSIIDGEAYCPCPADAAAILATEPMQAIASEAAVSAAVERISRWGMDGWTIECDSQDGTAYRVTVNGYDPKSSGWLPTLREALAVALGEDHD